MNINNIYSNKDMSTLRVFPEGVDEDEESDIKLNFPYNKTLSLIEFIHALSLVNTVNITVEDLKTLFKTKLKEYKIEEEQLIDKLSNNEKESNFTYFPHQLNVIKKLNLLNSGILADDMGLGKANSLLSLIKTNHKVIFLTNVAGKQIILSEGKRFTPNVKLSCPKEFSIPKESNTGFIFTYNSLPPLSKECKNKIPMEEFFKQLDKDTFLIADEFHNTKAYSAQRTKRFRALSKQVLKKNGKVIGATGSPILKDPKDLWCLLQNLNLTIPLFNTWDNYCELMGGSLQKNYKGRFFTVWDHEKINEKEVKRLLDPIIIRHTKDDVLKDLPEKIRSFIRIPVKGKDNKTVLDDYLKVIDEKVISKTTKNNVFKTRESLSIEKTDYAIEFIKEIQEESNKKDPLIVFSAFLSSAKRIAKEFNFSLITGDTSSEDRKLIEDRFQEGKIPGISATILAGGTALTLTQANKMIFIDRDWSNLNFQAEDRIRRIGQKKICNYYYIISDHEVEDRITELLHRKEYTGLRILKQSSNSSKPVTLITQLEKILNEK